MVTMDDSQIEKLLKDISFIKSAININKPFLQKLLLPAHFRLMSLFIGISVILFSLLYFFLIDFYGTYREIPPDYKNAMKVAIFLDWIFLVVFKYLYWVYSLKKTDPDYTLSRALEETLSFSAIKPVTIPLFVLVIFLSIALAHEGEAYYIVPTISIGFGIIYNIFGSVSKIKMYLVSGHWMLIAGICMLLYPSIPALIGLAVSAGGGMVLFFAISSFASVPDREV